MHENYMLSFETNFGTTFSKFYCIVAVTPVIWYEVHLFKWVGFSLCTAS